MPTKLTSYELLNTEEINVWRKDGPTGGGCLWEMHGVWGWDKKKKEAVALRENYFKKHPMTGKDVSGHYYSLSWSEELMSVDLFLQVEWYTDFYYPLTLKWAETVRSVSSPDKMVFLEPIPNEVGSVIPNAHRFPV